MAKLTINHFTPFRRCPNSAAALKDQIFRLEAFSVATVGLNSSRFVEEMPVLSKLCDWFEFKRAHIVSQKP